MTRTPCPITVRGALDAGGCASRLHPRRHGSVLFWSVVSLVIRSLWAGPRSAAGGEAGIQESPCPYTLSPWAASVPSRHAHALPPPILPFQPSCQASHPTNHITIDWSHHSCSCSSFSPVTLHEALENYEAFAYQESLRILQTEKAGPLSPPYCIPAFHLISFQHAAYADPLAPPYSGSVSAALLQKLKSAHQTRFLCYSVIQKHCLCC